MKILLSVLLMILAWPSLARDREPIIDMHMHALGAADQGPPPLGMCTPIRGFDAWDQRHPYQEQFLARLQHPPCADPVR